MPELPEVETIAAVLRSGGRSSPPVIGRRVIGADLTWNRTLAAPEESEFYERLEGQEIRAITRRGKFLVLELDRDYLLIHLRMSGDIYVEPEDSPPRPHDRLILHLDGGLRLVFNDTRKFGRVWLVEDPEVVTGGLGPEPFDPALTPEEFHARLVSRRRQLKPLLLDQSFLAGVGNIYADEALHLARLHPLVSSASLTPEQSARLLESIRTVLKQGIKDGGASIDWVYRGGGYQENFRVYDRTGKPCPVCGTEIKHIIVGQRSTHICPFCQLDTPQRGDL